MKSYLPVAMFTAMILIAMQLDADGPAPRPQNPAADSWTPRPIKMEQLPNAQWVTDKVISGGSPLGDPGFAQLQELGVRTIISVDGAKPDVASAQKYGLWYVHLPHGYDGVPATRAKELAKAVRDLPGAIYIHCHHGKHRSPAAAAVACVGDGTLKSEQALVVLQAAGTSPSYRGLYASALNASPFEPDLLDHLNPEFPASVAPPKMVYAMTALQHAVDNLKTIQQAGWRAPVNHPDLSPQHQALLLREHYTELLRTDESQRKPAKFQQMLRDSQAAARRLEQALLYLRASDRAAGANQAMETITQNCKSCHAKFRDAPLHDPR